MSVRFACLSCHVRTLGSADGAVDAHAADSEDADDAESSDRELDRVIDEEGGQEELDGDDGAEGQHEAIECQHTSTGVGRLDHHDGNRSDDDQGNTASRATAFGQDNGAFDGGSRHCRSPFLL